MVSLMGQKLPPGPSSPSLFQGMGMWMRPISWLERNRRIYGKRFTTKFPFTTPFVVIADPEQVKEIFTAPPDVLKPGVGARVLLPLVGPNSVLLLDGDAHMSQRKLMLPAFHGERMERLTGLMSEVTTAEVESWGDGEIELHPRFQSLTLEIILRAVFGLQPGPRLEALRESLAHLLAFGDNPLTLLPPPEDPARLELTERVFNAVGPIKGFVDSRDVIDELLVAEIEERRSAGDEDSDDVLSMLLGARHEDGSPMTTKELRDELMTLLTAGHETTASSLAWLVSRLAREPRVFDELRSEVDSEDGGPYLSATITEALRSRPVIPNAMPRYVAKPITVGGWDYEPGVNLVANAYLIHHDPEIYPDPYTFRPERFLDEKPGTYTWIPFGGGRRRCLGASFATLEMKVVIAELVRRFEISATTGQPELARRRNITVRPHMGARVSLGAREREPVPA
jgi:cytochrome P450